MFIRIVLFLFIGNAFGIVTEHLDNENIRALVHALGALGTKFCSQQEQIITAVVKPGNEEVQSFPDFPFIEPSSEPSINKRSIPVLDLGSVKVISVVYDQREGRYTNASWKDSTLEPNPFKNTAAKLVFLISSNGFLTELCVHPDKLYTEQSLHLLIQDILKTMILIQERNVYAEDVTNVYELSSELKTKYSPHIFVKPLKRILYPESLRSQVEDFFHKSKAIQTHYDIALGGFNVGRNTFSMSGL